MPENETAFAEVVAGETPALQCVVGGCCQTVTQAGICRTCREVEYACEMHMARAKGTYLMRTAQAIMAGMPGAEWRMACCGAVVWSFDQAMEQVQL